MLDRSVFLDRDGTINEEVNYLSRPEQLRLLQGAAAAIRQINEAGLKAVITTNQAGVARGYFSEEKLQQIHLELQKMLGAQEARLDAIYHCPHHPTHGQGPYKINCTCRKPKPGMLRRAARELKIDLSRSFVVGDKISDLEPGLIVGCRTILVRTGYGREAEQMLNNCSFQPDCIADTLLEATRWILSLQC